MAHRIESTDGMVLTGQPAWHGIGTVVEKAPTTREALVIAKLDWRVDALPVFARGPKGGRWDGDLPCESFRANVRSDTGAVLSIVGDGYVALQNSELAELIDGLGLERDGVKLETAGSLRGGRVVFFLARTATFALAGSSDELSTYTLFSNTHDGSKAFRALGTSVRVVCANTLNQATSGKAATEGLTIRHTESLPERVQEGRRVLGILGREANTFREQAEALAKRPMTDSDVRAFFLAVYKRANGPIPSNPTTEAEQRTKRRAVSTVADWLSNLDDPRQRVKGTTGTAWAALNAVTQWADHERTVRTSDAETDSRNARLHSNLFGSSATFKAEAFDEALELVGA